ncbi:hypothetical protein N7481_012906 [Penicillium waksmanii]|uniref:uncharacterized protein n=1 Tax=Penicillium waksmanii TaxID=69791 RepID=UPI00254994CA|nr:uncharacterized protein N7481_012906 [Penicillium waksmanii]KAJ5966192.1 hypothetical protein N7481_012906 [Penicillium waksmanii]
MAAVNQNMFGASITTDRPGGGLLMRLPLNLIVQIVSHVDDTGDLARLCRTCRVLNYMALPQLYRSLTLNSYGKIRYRNEQPEGIGSASPFTMGLNAIITRPYATLVRSITLRGDWKERELEEHSQVGRVPDSSMLLNIAVRAAVDRMTNLESFHWELNTKMLDTVYHGLTQLPRLTTLTIRFPSTRHPQPTFVLPGMPHLRSLKITDIDPLCYPDDIATMLLKSKKLRELKLHWSPRMRIAQEPSVSLHEYFRKCIAAKHPIPVKKLSFQNMYAFHTEEFNVAFDPTTVEDVTFLSGTDNTGFVNTFIENSWPTMMPHKKLQIKSIRVDAVSKRNSEFLGNFRGLERLYFVNVTADSSDYLNSPRPGFGPASSALTPPVHEIPNGVMGNSPAAASPASQLNLATSVRDSYLSHITTNHGASLRHLLLCSKWPLSTAMIARLVHSCPNLEQLALATEFSSMESLGMLVPFLRKLVALRLLIPAGSASPQGGMNGTAPNSATSHTLSGDSAAKFPKLAKSLTFSEQQQPHKFTKEIERELENARSLADIVDLDDDMLMEMMSYDLADKNVYGNVKVVGMGWKSFELRDFYKAPLPVYDDSESQSPDPTSDQHEATSEESGGHDTNGQSGADTTSTPATNIPASTLGKRNRDDDDESESRSRMSLYHTTTRESSESTHPGFVKTGCFPPVLTNDGQVSRRRMRRVGWEVLQHWEIWALDAQEI